jgi:hypothetical protein
MTSSNTLKKLVSIGAAMLLAVGGSLTSAAPASATAYQSASIDSGGTNVGGNNIAISVASCNFAINSTALTSPQLSDFTVLINGSSVTPVAGNFGGSYVSLGLASNLPAGALVSVAYTLAHGSITCANGTDTVGTFAAVTLQLPSPSPTMTGTSGNLNGTVGTAISMAAYTTTGLTSPVVYSYAINGGGSLPAGVSFNTSTGQITGTPTASVSNLSVTVTATGANSLTATATFNFSVTGGGGGGGGNPISLVSAPSYSISGNVATANDGTWSAAGTITRFWIICDNPHLTPGTTPYNDCYPVALTQNGSDERGATMNLQSSVWYGFSNSRTQVNFADKYFGLYVSINNGSGSYVTATVAGPAVAASVAAPLRAIDALRALKPLPTAVQPLVAALPILSKPMTSNGGKLNISEGNFTGLVSATVAGKSLDFILGKTGQITMTVPQGEAGKTADLTLTFNSGSIILQDAIKYVAPVVVANVPVRPVAIKAGAKSISESAADDIRHAALANLKNDTIQCVAYSASTSASAKAAAKLTAVQACGFAVKANPELKVADVEVIVDKVKARTQGVGIKVYKADN